MLKLGGFGEVLVVDWGIAKVLGRPDQLEESANVRHSKIHASPLRTEDYVETQRSSENAMKTRVGVIAGTPIYMSPEQANGEVNKIGPCSDIYTLGAILYEMLSGKLPYQGHGAQDVLEQVRAAAPPKPPSITFSGFRSR